VEGGNVASRIELGGTEWLLADVVKVWVRKSGSSGAIPIRGKILGRILENIVCEEARDIRAAIYVSKDRPAEILVRILSVEV
jgi:hypothetical protein